MEELNLILKSDDIQEKKAEKLKILIIKNSKTTKELLKNEKLSESEIKLLSRISEDSKKILEANIIKRLDLPYIKQVEEIIHTTANLDLPTLFSYEPAIRIENENEAGIYSNELNNVYFNQENEVRGKFVTGTTDTRLGIVDDLANLDKPSILKIKKFGLNYNEGLLYSEKIEDDYTLSAQFKLNRFPSKIHSQVMYKNGGGLIYTKKLTSRRTDILSFNYKDIRKAKVINEIAEKIEIDRIGVVKKIGIGKIEIGAMAPFATKNDTSVYSNRFSPYSICVSISNGSSKYSFYTDYKYELGEIQHLILKIKKAPGFDQQYIDDFESARNEYMNTEIVKSEDEKKKDTFLYDGKDWGEARAKLEINGLKKTLGNEFGSKFRYIITLNINGVQENIGKYHGKCWGNGASSADKKRNMIASGPGFMSRVYDEETKYGLVIKNSNKINWSEFLLAAEEEFNRPVIKLNNEIIEAENVTIISGIKGKDIDKCKLFFTNYNDENIYKIRYKLEPYLYTVSKSIKNSNEQSIVFQSLNLNELKSITSSPGNVAFLGDTEDFTKYKKIYSKYNHRMNNGIEIGSIKIQSLISQDGPEREPVKAL